MAALGLTAQGVKIEGVMSLGMRKRQTPKTRLGLRLRDARVASGLTQIELSDRSGVMQATISQIESGRNDMPSLRTLHALEVALNLPGGHLVLATDEVNSSFDRFLESETGKSLQLTPDEQRDIRGRRWHTANEDPGPAAWYDFCRAVRAMRASRSRQ